MKRLALLFLLLLSLPLFAQKRRDNEVSVSFGRIELKSRGGMPVGGVSYNRFWNAMLSTRCGAFGGEEDLFDHLRRKSSRVVHAAGEVHLFRGWIVSPYAGGGVAYADHRVGSRSTGEERDAKLAPLFNAGLDINITPRFAVALDTHYIRFGVESDDRFGSNLTSTTLMGSARFRW